MPQLTPLPKFRAVNDDGEALVGGKLYSYTAGTTTPKVTYSDYGGTPNANPVILDTRGEATVFLSGSYKLVLKDVDDETIWTVDDVRDLTTSQTFTNTTLAGTLTISGAAVTWSGNPTHSGNHTFSGDVSFSQDVAIGNDASDALTVAADAVTWSNNPTHTGNHTWSGTQTYSDDVTFNDPVTFADTVALSNGAVLANVYSPTLVGVANVNSASATDLMYSRLGPNVVVSGELTIDPDFTAPTTTTVGIPLPIASAFTNARHCGGTGICASVPSQTGAVYADATNDRAEYSFSATSTASLKHYICFQYRII